MLQNENWLNIKEAPKDGTLLLLLVQFIEHETEQSDYARTIGHNNFNNDNEDCWLFAGWCWDLDYWTEGKGIPIAYQLLPKVPENDLLLNFSENST